VSAVQVGVAPPSTSPVANSTAPCAQAVSPIAENAGVGGDRLRSAATGTRSRTTGVVSPSLSVGFAAARKTGVPPLRSSTSRPSVSGEVCSSTARITRVSAPVAVKASVVSSAGCCPRSRRTCRSRSSGTSEAQAQPDFQAGDTALRALRHQQPADAQARARHEAGAAVAQR
jgi:hypothetical protein